MSGLRLLTGFHCTAGLSFTGSHGTIDTGRRPLSDESVGLENLTARHLAFPSRMAGPQAAGERHEPCPRVFNRRDFSKAAGAASTLAPARVLGAGDQVRLGFIGVGNRGCQLLKAFLAHPDAKIVAICDVYATYLNAEYDKVDPRFASLGQPIPRMPELPSDVARVKDFRTVLDRQNIDAVVIATPDHWHAIQTIAACKAGRDVYVEKPLSITIAEGHAMVEAARRHERIVQVGTHRRSSRMYLHLADLVRSGVLGKVTVARASYCSNMATQGIGHAPESDSPADLDWDFWLGPRPARPFQATILPNKFRWWQLYSSQVANWGVQLLRPDTLADRRARAGVGLGPRRQVRGR